MCEPHTQDDLNCVPTVQFEVFNESVPLIMLLVGASDNGILLPNHFQSDYRIF